MARTKSIPRVPPGKGSMCNAPPQKNVKASLERVKYLEGREGIRDKSRALQDMFKTIHTSTASGAAVTADDKDLIAELLDAFELAAQQLQEDGGHRFDEDYLHDHGAYGVATIILHTIAPTNNPRYAPFGVTSALLPLYPPTRAGERPILCKTNKDVGDLIALIRPDIASEDAASTPVGGYMAQCKHYPGAVLLFPDTLVGHAWELLLLDAMLNRTGDDPGAVSAVKAKLCGGDGFSRSQHKITMGKFKFCMPEVLEEQPEFMDTFFQTKKRKDSGAVSLQFVPRQRTDIDVFGAFAAKLKACEGCSAKNWAVMFAYSLVNAMRDLVGPAAVEDVLYPYITLPPQALLAVVADDESMSRIIRSVTAGNIEAYGVLMNSMEATRAVIPCV